MADRTGRGGGRWIGTLAAVFSRPTWIHPLGYFLAGRRPQHVWTHRRNDFGTHSADSPFRPSHARHSTLRTTMDVSTKTVAPAKHALGSPKFPWRNCRSLA